MADHVQVNIDGKILECPVIVGTEGEKAFDITKLRSQTGFITMDPQFQQYRFLQKRHFLYRRRQRYPALSRHSGRTAGRGVHFCGDVLPS